MSIQEHTVLRGEFTRRFIVGWGGRRYTYRVFEHY